MFQTTAFCERPRVERATKKMHRSSSVSDVFTWANNLDAHNLPSLKLTLPPDVPSSPRARESTCSTSTIRPTSSVSQVDESLGHVAQDFGFDCSCLNGLDDQLITSPTASFTDLCYQSCLEDDRDFIPPVGRNTPTSVSHPIPEFIHDDRVSIDDPGSFFSDDSDEDTDECPTRDGHHSLSFSTWFGRSGDLVDAHPVGDFAQVDGLGNDGVIVFDTQRPAVSNESFIHFESGWATGRPQESISFFPTPGTPKPKPNRLAAFVSHFPNKLPRFGGSPLHSHQTAVAVI
ncbi:hypothetical protein BDN72DRAFT_893043 [Pluteus cervinus]|uniref:Uncharacterized protein n=1 Tax=Pluteus cervinus TaxID=181527 RepID=A0ACD3BA31_9AGAR|nr:hypothetical protein BDN72DRAFT_893043 [Pluteus cervinus]